MKKFLLPLATASILFSTSCKKEVEPQPPTPPKQLEVVWKTRTVPEFNGNTTNSLTPFLYGNEVVFSSWFNKKRGVGDRVIFLDTANGKLNRSWGDLSSTGYSEESVVHWGDYLLFGDQRRVECLNLLTGSTAWKGSVASTWTTIYVHNGFAYRGFPYDYQNGEYNSCRLKRTPVDANAWQTVYDFTRTDNFHPGFVGCGFGNLPNGDEVVVWKNWSFTASNSNRVDIFAYNLTADSLMWRNTDFRKYGSVSALKVVGDAVYGSLSQNMFAVDLASGKTLWQQDFSGQKLSLPISDPLFHVQGSYVIVKGPSDELIYVRKNYGTIWKVVYNVPQISEGYSYFENKLFGIGGSISIIDIATGVNLLKGYDQSNVTTHSWHHANSRITIDPIRRVFYCHDGVYAYCIKIPDL
jgi:hypothetical protein